MSSPAHSPTVAAGAARLTSRQRVQACVQQLAQLLPAQAPLRDFVHHNTLHAFQHLPFAEALGAAARLTGARPWLAEERCRELFRQGRVNSADLLVALRQVAASRPDELLLATPTRKLCRGEVLQAVLLYPAAAMSPARLLWQIEETPVFERLPADLDALARQRLLANAGADGRQEAVLLADLWTVARALCACAPKVDPAAAAAAAAVAVASWETMRDRLGNGWTFGELLARLSGEDFRPTLQAALIRHLAAHLDQGLAAWRNPARTRGFYAAWRQSAGRDWAWELDEFAGARHDLEQLPDDPWQLIADELLQLGVDESRWFAYLQRLVMELPGWAGMSYWRECHSRAGDPPVSLTDLLAVRVVLERLYAEQLVRRIWGLPLDELGDYFRSHPAELSVRHAVGTRPWPDEVLDLVRPHLLSGATGSGWQLLADRLTESRIADAAAVDEEALAAWPLFVLAQRLGLGGNDLRAIGTDGVAALLACAVSLSDEQRGLVWLLAYEHHYRQQILAALSANHGRVPALSGKAMAQLVFCMDDREEGTRRHLEEVNPAYETFGAAGFFGVPMLWQGLDDELPSALCPVVVRPQNAVCEAVPAGSEVAYRQHQQRRRLRLAARERLHQGSRRGWLQASLLTVVAAPAALLGLLARSLAPARLGALLERWRDAFDRPLAGALQLTAASAEAARVATADTPRLGFSEDEQVARVGGFLRSIGLSSQFAPLVLIVGHGSDSRNNPHLAAYDCGACSGRHGGPNARVLAALANRPAVRGRLALQGVVIPDTTHFVGAEHNTCDESFAWYDEEQLPASHRERFAALRRDCEEATRQHAVERCRRFASAPPQPSPEQAREHLADRRQDIAQARPELGHATIAAAFIGRRSLSRGAFFDRRVFLISYDPLSDGDGRILEATLLAAGPVGAGINLEYYFSTVNNQAFGCGSKVMHNLAGLFGVMQGASSDLRTGLPLQMVEVHEAMRLLVIVEQATDIVSAIYQRQPPLQELIGNGWIVLAAKHPQTGVIDLFDATTGWQPWHAGPAGKPTPALPEVERSRDWFAGQRELLPPALLRRPVMTP
ncbi:MAG: DUF2309 domain-containing protein [Candidatus Accumulibacter sp.]|uniref:Probable inorganic carbon transporter subunit DabA n=1 Tax=Candidatus Accumulibacter affinis TaxID=2954384 RepID=A0A935W4F9_9PROT|nr:DUF2309 domain-containing protein [Candidatus Accumulibacter affinis]